MLLFLACFDDARVALSSLTGRIAHHSHELVEVDLSVAVDVDLGDGGVELLLGVHAAELLARQQLEKLVRVDLPAAVLVKHLESGPQVRLSRESLLVHCGRQEL